MYEKMYEKIPNVSKKEYEQFIFFIWKFWGPACFVCLLIIRWFNVDRAKYFLRDQAFISLLFLLCLCIAPLIQNIVRNTFQLRADRKFALTAINIGAIILWIAQFGEELVRYNRMNWKFGLFAFSAIAMTAAAWYLWILWTPNKEDAS